MKSVMKHQFSEVPKASIQRSSFDRSHGHKSAFDSGLLIPVYVDEALPGDTFKMNASVFARMATPIVPVMDNAKMTIHFFAVPMRLVWNNSEKFFGAQDNPGDTTDYLVPQLTWGGEIVLEGSIHDYMGFPLGEAPLANALHHRAYNLIYNEWYRDQNLQQSLPVPLDDGPDDVTQYQLVRRGKRHDYFTSALPWPQKGPGVEIPIGDSAPLEFVPDGFRTESLHNLDGTIVAPGSAQSLYAGTDGFKEMGTPGTDVISNMQNTHVVDLSSATAATINSLRMAFQLQKMYEKDARGGTRYTEMIKAHFNVTSPDARLQRPEYLGGGSIPISTQPVPQTGGTADSIIATPQGNLAGFTTASGSGIGFNRSFTEHMVIIGLASVTCDLTYQQGLERMWSRRSRFDFYWPTLAHLGEQEILNKEIYHDDAGGTNDDVFGYQERYAEYRYKPSRISGAFRSTAAAPLDIWHYSQNFAALPTLSPEFIEENPPISRTVAVPSEPEFLFDSYFNLICDRPMPVYSVPGLIDHF